MNLKVKKWFSFVLAIAVGGLVCAMSEPPKTYYQGIVEQTNTWEKGGLFRVLIVPEILSSKVEGTLQTLSMNGFGELYEKKCGALLEHFRRDEWKPITNCALGQGIRLYFLCRNKAFDEKFDCWNCRLTEEGLIAVFDDEETNYRVFIRMPSEVESLVRNAIVTRNEGKQ